MGMPAQDLTRRWTREEVLALPDDGNRYELVDGELLVSPAPRPLHERAVRALSSLLDPFVRAQHLGTLYAGLADLDLTSGQLVQPDLFVSTRRGIRAWEEVGIPLLVVEVLSPRTARFDRVTKRVRYQRARVPTLWIVDLDARLVEVWMPDAEAPTIAVESLEWRPDPAGEALSVDLPRLFAEVDEG
jgi:Uma2 family endonuclease